MKAEISRLMMEVVDRNDFDFYGIGEFEADKRRLRWVWTKGSVSSRTLLMAQKRGTGLAGVAIRSGRLVLCDESVMHAEWESILYDDPVMLAERLRAASAISIDSEGVSGCGVLLVGFRRRHRFSATEQDDIQQLSARIAEHWQVGTHEGGEVDDQASNC